MTLSGDAVYIVTYCIFLVGASYSFQKNGPAFAVWIMGGAMAIDFLASIIPLMKVKSLVIDIPASPAITVGIFLGIFNWVLFLFALFVWKIRKLKIFHTIILEIEIIWFVAYILVLYGVYKVPLR